MTLTGYAYTTMQGLINGLTTADVIAQDPGKLPADGYRDIVLVGMDSRTDAQGNPLPKKMLAKLNAGVAEGELNTDTIIYIRVPNDGSKAVAVSLPRDSYVTIPGFGKHKINSAYARGKLAARKQLVEEGVQDKRELDVRSNKEGAKTLISTVERLTGTTVDNYASINLLGFFQITKAIGGIDVCLKEAVNDPYSGAQFKAGRQTIQGQDALAFVRQRHGLLRGDLDRVVRQQVFLAGLAKKVLSAGTLADPAKLNSLVDAIQKSVVVNKGWDILAFAQQMRGLTGGQIEFRTLPVQDAEYQTETDGTAIRVNPSAVRSFVAEISGDTGKKGKNGQGPAPEEIQVDVYNTTEISGLAGTVSEKLVAQGFTEGEIANESPRQRSVVQTAQGEKAAGKVVAGALDGLPVETSPQVQSGHVRVLLAPDYESHGNSAPPAYGGGAAEPAASGSALRQPSDDAKKPITADGITCVN